MVMLMIKFGAYKAAGVVGCVLPPFARTTKLMMKRRSSWARARKESEKSGFRTKTALLPSFFRLLLSFSPPSPPPQEEEGSFFSVSY